jgi:hypothetical protein
MKAKGSFRMVFRLLTPSSHHHPPLLLQVIERSSLASSPAPSLTGDRKIKDTCKHKKETADDGPRHPLSAYNIFFSQMRTIIRRRAKRGSLRLATRSN